METVENVNRPDEPGEPVRPRIVTVVGRTWLILGIFYFAVAIVDLIAWVALGPAMPTILSYAQEKEPALRFLRPYFEHYGAIKSIEAIFAAAVTFSAYKFLKLRAWARGALEAASWIYLVYVLAFIYVSYTFRLHGPVTRAGASNPYTMGRMVGGFGLGILLIGALIWMIVLLRGRKIRAAFAIPRG